LLNQEGRIRRIIKVLSLPFINIFLFNCPQRPWSS
jgi:hypothetical protein